METKLVGLTEMLIEIQNCIRKMKKFSDTYIKNSENRDNKIIYAHINEVEMVGVHNHFPPTTK